MSGGEDRDLTPRPFYIVAAHGGAGFHPPASDSLLKRSLRTAISPTLTVFSRTPTLRGTASSGGTESLALDAVTSLIAALEDAPEFNAGYGSNLTFDGNVECDASLMSTTITTSEEDGEEDDNDHHPSSSSLSSRFLFGSVGAVRGVRNPVLLARRVLEGRRRQPERERDRVGLGRVPPLMLVGEGAVQFAREQSSSSSAGAGVRIVDDPEEMVAPRARREWCAWKERYRRWEDESDLGLDLPLGRERGCEGETEVSADVDDDSGGGGGGGGGGTDPYARQDTVGAVALVRMGKAGDGDAQQQAAAAGVSSGGLLLKHSGRVGEAAVFGAGCWAERLGGGRSVACSVSGQGELIVQSSLAKTLAERVATTAEGDTHDTLRSVLVDHFYRKWDRQGEYQPAVGVLLLTRGVDGDEGTGL